MNEIYLLTQDERELFFQTATVTWFHEKIGILLSHVNWEPDSFQMTFLVRSPI